MQYGHIVRKREIYSSFPARDSPQRSSAVAPTVTMGLDWRGFGTVAECLWPCPNHSESKRKKAPTSYSQRPQHCSEWELNVTHWYSIFKSLSIEKRAKKLCLFVLQTLFYVPTLGIIVGSKVKRLRTTMQSPSGLGIRCTSLPTGSAGVSPQSAWPPSREHSSVLKARDIEA